APARQGPVAPHCSEKLSIGRKEEEPRSVDGYIEHAQEDAVRGAMHSIAKAPAGIVHSDKGYVGRVEGFVGVARTVRLQDRINESAVVSPAGPQPAIRRAEGHIAG